MSSRFVTIADALPEHFPVIVWEEREGAAPRVLSRHASPEEVPDAADLEWHRFTEVTTLKTASEANKAAQPIVDADGAPLWRNARVAFCIPSHYINTVSGQGTFESVSRYGGSTLVCDEALPVYLDRSGSYRERSHRQYVTTEEYVRQGDLKGFRKLSGKLGDRFEHGRVDVFIRLADDPRKDACEPIPNPVAGPRP